MYIFLWFSAWNLISLLQRYSIRFSSEFIIYLNISNFLLFNQKNQQILYDFIRNCNKIISLKSPIPHKRHLLCTYKSKNRFLMILQTKDRNSNLTGNFPFGPFFWYRFLYKLLGGDSQLNQTLDLLANLFYRSR